MFFRGLDVVLRVLFTGVGIVLRADFIKSMR